ncbi:MAG: response regulator [Chloroflexi bacterium]|nr:response regulator [Ktedonobacteraceae bacterium]MBV9706488.1 response regulator [Chloroflexota bacterium]
MGKRILVVEPSPTLRAILQMYFERDGHQVALFEDYQAATQALPRFQIEPPELAFVAIHANRPESFDLVRALRQQYAWVRLVLLIMQEESNQFAVQRLVETAQAAALLKPFSIKDVLALVATSVLDANAALGGANLKRES